MLRIRLIPVVVIFCLVTLSCALLAPPTQQAPDTDQVSTIVAQTVEAKAIQPTETEQVAPTEVPVIEDTIEPPPPPEPAKLLVAFTDTSQNLWLWSEDGQIIPLSQTGDVLSSTISENGQMIAYLRSADTVNYSLWVVQSDGSNIRELVSQAEFNQVLNNPGMIGLSPADLEYATSIAPYQYEWMPGEDKLLFNTMPRFEGPGLVIHDDLWQVNAQTGEQTVLLQSGQGGNFYFSPDGTQLALVTAQAISLINADMTNRRDAVLSYPPVITYSEYRYYPSPSWASDSSFLLVNIPPEDPLKEPPDSTLIYRIPADGSQPALLTSLVSFFLEDFHFSPDGSRMAFLTMEPPASSNLQNLHIANADGSQETLYTTGNPRFSGWSPDSTHFIFTEAGWNNPRIGKVGGNPQSMNGVDQAVNFNWIDAEEFVFLAKAGQNWQLRLVGLDASSSILYNFGPITEPYWIHISTSR